VELQRAVQECSETGGGVEEPEEYRKNTHRRLVSILNRLIQEGGASGEGGGAWERKDHVHTALNFWVEWKAGRDLQTPENHK